MKQGKTALVWNFTWEWFFGYHLHLYFWIWLIMYLSWWSSNISIVGLIIVALLVRLKAENTFLIMWLFEKQLTSFCIVIWYVYTWILPSPERGAAMPNSFIKASASATSNVMLLEFCELSDVTLLMRLTDSFRPAALFHNDCHYMQN